MGLESGTYISDLVTTNPAAGDAASQGDDHLRLIKSTVKNTFPNVTGAVTPTHTELNYVDGVTSAIQAQLDAKAATTYVDSAVAAGSPGQWVKIKEVDVTGASTVDFVNGTGGVVINSTYDEYEVAFVNVAAVSGGVTFHMRTSTNAGVSYDSGTSDYYNASASGSSMILLGGGTQASGTTVPGINGFVRFSNPDLAKYLGVLGVLIYQNSSLSTASVQYAGFRATLADVDAIRFYLSTGNFDSGTMVLRGRKK